jgi:arylsulfatase A-like enzyme
MVGKTHVGPFGEGTFNLVRRGGGPSGCEQWVPTLRDRPKDKPFFLWLAAFDPHRDYQPGAIPDPHDPAKVMIPPYLPDTPEVRKDLALYYDEVGRLDRYVGEVLAELDKQGVANETLVVFLSDNGRPFPRCKTTLYDSGTRTPLIARWPGRIKPGSTCGGLVSTIDLAPTVLTLAGAEVPAAMQGTSIAKLFQDPAATVRGYVFTEKNWHDFDDHARAVRTTRYKYIRHSYTDIPLTPPADAVKGATFQAMRTLRDAGKLTPEQRVVFTKPRPAEELYDVQADPDELKNLAADPTHADRLKELRAALDRWAKETNDAVPAERTPDGFDRETGVQLKKAKKP